MISREDVFIEKDQHSQVGMGFSYGRSGFSLFAPNSNSRSTSTDSVRARSSAGEMKACPPQRTYRTLFAGAGLLRLTP